MVAALAAQQHGPNISARRHHKRCAAAMPCALGGLCFTTAPLLTRWTSHVLRRRPAHAALIDEHDALHVPNAERLLVLDAEVQGNSVLARKPPL